MGLGGGLEAIREHLTRANYSTSLVAWARCVHGPGMGKQGGRRTGLRVAERRIFVLMLMGYLVLVLPTRR